MSDRWIVENFRRLWFRTGVEAIGNKQRKLQGTLYALLLHERADGSCLLLPERPYPAEIISLNAVGASGTPRKVPEAHPKLENAVLEALVPVSWLLSAGRDYPNAYWHSFLGFEYLGRLPEQDRDPPWSVSMQCGIGTILSRASGAAGFAVKGAPRWQHTAWTVADQSAIRGARLLLGESAAAIAVRLGTTPSQWKQAETEDEPMTVKEPVYYKDHPLHVYNEDSDVPNESISRARAIRPPRSRQRRLPVEQLERLIAELETRVRPRPGALIRELEVLRDLHDQKSIQHRLRGERKVFENVDD